MKGQSRSHYWSTHEDKVWEYMFRSVLRQMPIKTIICVASLSYTFKMYKASYLQQLQETDDSERQIDVEKLILKIWLLIYWRMWGNQDIEMLNMMDTYKLDTMKFGTSEVCFKWDFGIGMFSIIIITFLG